MGKGWKANALEEIAELPDSKNDRFLDFDQSMGRRVMTFAARLLTIILLLSVSTEVSFAAENNKTLAPLYQLLLSKGVFKAPSNLFYSACSTTGSSSRLIADCWMLYWQDNTENESGFRIEKKCWVDGDPEPAAFELWQTTPPDTTKAQYRFGEAIDPDPDCPAEGPAVWKFRVQAFNDSLTSDYAGPIMPYKCPDLNPPAGFYNPLQLTPGYGTIQLTWVDYTNDETNWRIHREEVDAGENVVSIIDRYIGANLETFLDEYLKSSTKYSYSVNPIYESANMFCEGWPPQLGNATTLFTSDVPSGPTSLTVLPVDKKSTELELKWTDNANNESGFFVYRSTDNSNFEKIQTLPENSSSFTDTSLTPCTTYYYRVAAYNAFGSSNDAVGNGITAPAPPTGLIASQGTVLNLIYLDWQAADACADTYNVYELSSAGADWQLLGQTGDILATIGPLTPAVYLFYRISALDADGDEGAPCDYEVGWGASPIPTSVSASRGTFPDRIRLQWKPVQTCPQGQGVNARYINQYDIEWASTVNGPYTKFLAVRVDPDAVDPAITVAATPDPVIADIMAGTNYAYFPGVTQGTKYFFRVYSTYKDDVDCDGAPDSTTVWQSDPSAPTEGWSQSTVPSYLPAPTNVRASDGTSTTQIDVTWNAVAGATSYNVYRGSSTWGPWTKIKNNVGGTSWTNKTTDSSYAIIPGTGYWYFVTAVNATGEGYSSAYDGGYAITDVMTR